MKKFLLFVLYVLCFLAFIGAVKYVDNAGEGYQVYPQVVAAAPAAPFACAAAHIGKLIYVDDNNDTAEAFICHCGTDADDTTYIWLRTDAPATDCFP